MFRGRVGVSTYVKSASNVEILGFGEDNRVVNEGDLLMLWVKDDTSGPNGQKVVIELYIRGCDLRELQLKVKEATALYKLNQEYLSQPVARY